MILGMVMRIGADQWHLRYDSRDYGVAEVMARLVSLSEIAPDAIPDASFYGRGESLLAVPPVLPDTDYSDAICTRCGSTSEVERCACDGHAACRLCDSWDAGRDDSVRYYC